MSKIHYKENVYDDAIGHFINGKYERCYDTKEEDHQEALVNLLNGYETQIAEKDKEIERLKELVELTEKDLADKRRQRNIYRRQCEQWRDNQ